MNYDIINDYFSSYFRDKRIRNGYSIRYVAERIGIPKSTYYAYENNDRSISQEYIKQLLLFYNDDGTAMINGLRLTCDKYILGLWAYINGYEVVASYDNDEQKENIRAQQADALPRKD